MVRAYNDHARRTGLYDRLTAEAGKALIEYLKTL
jgi:hypothetical protein